MGPTSMAVQRREKYPNHFDAGRPNDDDEHAREDKENERQEQLDRQFGCHLFGFQSTCRTHRIRMDSERLANTGPEPVSLHKQCDQRSYLFQIRAMSKIPEGLLSRHAVSQFKG